MIFLRIAAILFLVLTLIFSIMVVRIFRLQKRGVNFADFAFPMLAVAYYLISDKAFYHSWLPWLVLSLSILAIAVVLFFVFVRRSYSFHKFLKFFWRSGFILTFLLYLGLVIYLFFL